MNVKRRLFFVGVGVCLMGSGTACLSDAPVPSRPVRPTVSVAFDPETLTIEVGDVVVQFSAQTSWTLRRATYRSREWLVPTGFMQSVLKERFDTRPEGVDVFLGSGHRPEAIDRLAVVFHLSGGREEARELKEGFHFKGEAEAVTFLKCSRFVSEQGGCLLVHEARVRVGAGGIEEDFSYVGGDGALGRIELMYPFMHCFPNSTERWMVGADGDGILEEGRFKDDNTFTLSKPVRWVSIYDPVTSIGTLYRHPETYHGRPGMHTMFWNRPRDNKLYFATGRLVDEEGEARRLHVALIPFEARPDTWKARAMSLLDDSRDAILNRATNPENGALGDRALPRKSRKSGNPL